MGDMADWTNQQGEEAYYRRQNKMAFKKTYGNKKPQSDREFRTVGNAVLAYNQGFDEDKVGEKGAPPLFTGFYEFNDPAIEDEAVEAVIRKIVLWKRAKYNGEANGILATGVDSAGNAVFLRVSGRTETKFFGSVVEQLDKDTLGEQLFNFTFFDGDNSSAWSGTLQIEVGGAKPQAAKTPVGTAKKSKSSNMPF